MLSESEAGTPFLNGTRQEASDDKEFTSTKQSVTPIKIACLPEHANILRRTGR